jgi:hypothetical protein
MTRRHVPRWCIQGWRDPVGERLAAPPTQARYPRRRRHERHPWTPAPRASESGARWSNIDPRGVLDDHYVHLSIRQPQRGDRRARGDQARSVTPRRSEGEERLHVTGVIAVSVADHNGVEATGRRPLSKRRKRAVAAVEQQRGLDRLEQIAGARMSSQRVVTRPRAPQNRQRERFARRDGVAQFSVARRCPPAPRAPACA